MNSTLDGARLITPDRILDGLRMDIVSQKYKTGDRIVEAEISEQYGASRGSVRTAIKELEAEGLVKILSNGRKEVIGFSTKQARDVYDLRYLLENRAVEIVLEEKSINLAPMVEVLHKIEECAQAAPDQVDWYALDIQFHHALVMAAQNRPLLTAWKTNMSVMYALMRPNRVQSDEGYRQGFYQQHKELFGTIATYNPHALTMLKQHILSARP